MEKTSFNDKIIKGNQNWDFFYVEMREIARKSGEGFREINHYLRKSFLMLLTQIAIVLKKKFSNGKWRGRLK